MIVFFNMISFLIQAIGHDFDNDDYHRYQFSIYFVHIETLTPVLKKKLIHSVCSLIKVYRITCFILFQKYISFKIE